MTAQHACRLRLFSRIPTQVYTMIPALQPPDEAQAFSECWITNHSMKRRWKQVAWFRLAYYAKIPVEMEQMRLARSA